MTLVSIVGDFYSSVLPLFFELHPQIERHIIVYDDFKTDVEHARDIFDGTKRFIKTNKLPIETYTVKLDEDSKESIERAISGIVVLCPKMEEIYVNVTDGLANIALLMSHKYLDKGMNFLTYDRYDNTYNLLNKDTMQQHSMQRNMTIEEHFMLKNIKVVHENSTQLAKKYAYELVEYFEYFDANAEGFIQTFPNKKELLDTANGFLYEFYIYNLLKDLNHDDIRVGIKVEEPSNEFDILILKENHLHMIECKFQEYPKKVDLLYKLDSVRSTLDDESKVMLVSHEEFYDIQRDNENYHPTTLYKRANMKRIYLRGSPLKDVERFIREVDQIFELKTQNLDAILANRIKPKLIKG